MNWEDVLNGIKGDNGDEPTIDFSSGGLRGSPVNPDAPDQPDIVRHGPPELSDRGMKFDWSSLTHNQPQQQASGGQTPTLEQSGGKAAGAVIGKILMGFL